MTDHTRRTVLAGLAVGLAGCTGSSGGSDDVILDEERVTCGGIRFDLEAGETVTIDWEILERGPEYSTQPNAVEVRVETVADGTVAEWELLYRDVEDTFRYTARRSGDHSLDCSRVGVSHITIRRVDDA